MNVTVYIHLLCWCEDDDFKKDCCKFLCQNSTYTFERISINRVWARVRVPSKRAFPNKWMLLFTFTFCANERMMISIRIAASFCVRIPCIHLRWYLLIGYELGLGFLQRQLFKISECYCWHSPSVLMWGWWFPKRLLKVFCKNSLYAFEMISIDRVWARVRVPSKTAFPN